MMWTVTIPARTLTFVLLFMLLSGVLCTIRHTRSYDLLPEYDTFIQGLHEDRYRLDYIELGKLDGIKSRILLKFNVSDFYRQASWSNLHSVKTRTSVVKSATLKLFCVNVITSANENREDHVFSDNVNIASILVPWDVYNVTSLLRSTSDRWSQPYLGTVFNDATAPFETVYVEVDYTTCQSSDNVATVSLSVTQLFKEWLDNPENNFGVLLWADDDDNDIGVLKLASSEHAFIHKHPTLKIVVEDTIINETGSCSGSEFYCLEGRCIDNDKVCNFITDCLYDSDEALCGSDCNFENTTCNWEMLLSELGVVGWRMAKAMDMVPYSAPSTDYSEGSLEGHYAVLSSSLIQNSTIAHVISPNYTQSGPQCILQFYYQFSGEAAVDFRVYVRMPSKKDVLLWSFDTESGTSWQEKLIRLGRISEPFSIVFEGTVFKQDGTEGYIALDSVSFQYCSPVLPRLTCSTDEMMCSSNDVCFNTNQLCDYQDDCLFGDDEKHEACSLVPYGSRCNFEDNSTCGWHNVLEGDQFNWTRNRGPTRTSKTGPSVDHTMGTAEGYYMYIETSQIVNNYKALFHSPIFPPPPPATRTFGGEYYQRCQLRFWYHIYGQRLGILKVYVIQDESVGQLFESPRWINSDMWVNAVVPLPESVTNRYLIEFEGSRGLSYLGDIAIDDVSLSPECFDIWPSEMTTTLQPTNTAPPVTTNLNINTTTSTYDAATPKNFRLSSTHSVTTDVSSNITDFSFTTCNNLGRSGPTQMQCDAAYSYTHTSVVVLEDDDTMKGVQVWTVPVSAFYSIKAEGASGGSGVENSGPSKGAMVEAVFHFNTGEQIYLLVGQEGQSACETVPTLGKEYCTGTVTDEERSDLGPQGRSAGGGGGGGGATFVFQVNNTSYDAIPLLVAGGGGGLAFSQSPALHDVHGKTAMYPGNGTNGLSSSLSANDVPGSGGGWNDSTPAGPDGKSLLEGGEGGDGCELAYKELRWKTQGGFGGGGGACSSGGGGGGYSGGYAAMRKTLDNNGQGGTSIIHPSAVYSSQEAGQNIGHGSVFIMRVIECHGDEVLSDDRKSCIIPNSEAKLLSIPLTAGIAAGAIFLVVVLILMVSLLVMTMHKKKRQKMQITKFQDMTEYQLAKLRKDAAIDFNPNYELGDGIAKLDDLNEVPREHLELISALGHGAFGEVYEGSFILPDSGEKIKVAVKTLPENSTKQDEIEFLMEALILTKFNHPNIVKCVGVCFLQVPRFIILELMRGGELKDFLREFRPIKEKPSTLKIIDLLYIAMDIAKGCDYLETSRFIHRDIAARNILLTTKEADRVAKIGDFGMARDIYKSDYYRKGGKAMLPVKWMPPEAYLDGIFTSKADVWAFGVLLWEIMSLGYMPYPGMSNQEVMQYVAQGERMHPPRNCPMPVYRIMTQCWQQYPEDRPSFSTIKERLGYCVQDPDVLSTPLPVCSIADDRNKARRPIIRPRNVTSSMHVIDSHEIKNFSQPSTATPSLNSSLNSLSDIRFVPYLDDQLREVDNRKPSEEPCNSSFNSTDVATVNKSLDPEPDSRDSSFNLLNVPAKKNMIDGDSEVSGNEETDLLSPERRNSKNHTSDLPTVNGETDPALESDTHSLSNVSDSSDVDGSPKRKLFCVKKDSGVVMMFDKDASGCQV